MNSGIAIIDPKMFVALFDVFLMRLTFARLEPLFSYAGFSPPTRKPPPSPGRPRQPTPFAPAHNPRHFSIHNSSPEAIFVPRADTEFIAREAGKLSAQTSMGLRRLTGAIRDERHCRVVLSHIGRAPELFGVAAGQHGIGQTSGSRALSECAPRHLSMAARIRA